MSGRPDHTENKLSRRGRKAEDLRGRTFGKLTVLERAESKSDRVTWKCLCSCGEYTTATSYALKSGGRTDCGCGKKENHRKIDITGRRYGKLIAICPTDRRNALGSIIWKCRCDCGKETEASVLELNSGNRKSCGCLREECQQLLHDRLHLIDGTCVEWLEGRKGRTDNTSGFRGVFRKKNGRYSVSIGFKKKIFYIGVFEEYQDAVDARRRAEYLIHDGFLTAHRKWESMAEQDPEWAEKNPFVFDVTKEDGRLVIHNSMERFIHTVKDSMSGPGGGETEGFSGSRKGVDTVFLDMRETVTEKADPSEYVPDKGVYSKPQAVVAERELVPAGQ